jgi:hypothetical protein
MDKMWRSVIYDILKEGDRHLHGKIAELIFERVRSSLLGRTLHCCDTTRLSFFLAINPTIPSTDVSSLIHNYATKLNLARKALEMSPLEVSVALLREKIKKLKGLCLFCLQKGRTLLFIERGGDRRAFFACEDCFSKCLEKALLRSEAGITRIYRYPALTGPIELSTTRYFFDDKNGTLHGLVWSLVEALDLLENLDIVEVLSKLDVQARDLLRELYRRGSPGQHPFDYVCVDDQGCRYLVDVTSVRGIDASPPPLSKREREVVAMAKEKGFKVLVPVVRFLSDWRVLIELVEV